MSTKSVKSTTSADSKNVVVSFTSDSDDDDESSPSSSSSSSSSSDSSSESDVETTEIKSDKPPPTPPPTTTSEAVEASDEVETVSFTLSLSAVTTDDSPVEEATKKEEKVETKQLETKTASTAVAAAEDEVKPARIESPKHSPDAVIKSTESDAVETKKKTPAKKATKSITKSLKTEAINGGEELGVAEKAQGKIVATAESSNTYVPVSEVAADTETTLSLAPAAETMEEDDAETVSFTLSLSAVNDDSPAEKAPKEEQKTEPKTSKDEEAKTKTEAAEKVKQAPQEIPRNSPDAVIKSAESDVAETKKKTTVKKASRTTTRFSKAEAMNGSEKLDASSAKMENAAPVTEEKVVVQAEATNTSASVSEVLASTVNGETKTATKTVKKKTKKVAGDTTTAASADAVVEEKSATKEITTQNEAVTNTEPSKTSTINTVDETSNAVNGEAKSAAKSAKKKPMKKAATESETIQAVTEEKKEASRTEDKAAVNEKTEHEISAEKSEPAKALPVSSVEVSAANEVAKTAAETTVVKKKTKKVASDVKSTAAQEDVKISVENLSANKDSSAKQTDDATKPKNSQEIKARKSAVEAVKTSKEPTNSGADMDAAVPEPTTSDKVIVKKKKPKKAAASAAAESAETALISETEQSSVSNANIDVTQAAAADADLSEKAQQDVTVIKEVTVIEPVADIFAEPSNEISGAKDANKSPSPVVPVIANTEESETSNIVTVIHQDDISNDASTQKTSYPVETSSSGGDASTETKPVTSVDALTLDSSAQDSKNEESDYSYRRKSMDDFIKRILAEAREEQQKRMAVTTNNGSDAANLLESTANDLDNLGPTNKETSLLDRRLASTDRKRMQKDEFGDWTTKNMSGDVDLDQDLAEIGQYFARRNPTGTSKYDVELERNLEWSGSRVRDVDNAATSSTLVNGQDGRRPQQNGLSEDSFVPHAREETAELVHSSSRPVRAIIDQQSDVVQLLKTTARSVDDFESEIRNLRATFLDRQARIETLRNAVDAEVRAYQADQQAANERIQQQQIPGGHFVRDEFMRANNIGPSSRSSAIDELLAGAAPRRRSGSVSGTSGIVSGAVPSGMSSNDLDYKSSALSSWVLGARSTVADQPRRNDVDDDASSTASGYSTTRSRRAGSLIRERTYMTEDAMGPRMETSRSYLLPTYDNSSPYSFGETSVRSSYAPLQTSSSTQSYYQSDYGPTSSAAAPSYYGATDTRGYYGSDSRSYGYSPLSSRATNDPSRFRRAQSVSDFTSERPMSSDRPYNSAVLSSTGQFQSRFLDKVRARKAYGDDQYRSHFLASDSGSSRYSSRRDYSSND